MRSYEVTHSLIPTLRLSAQSILCDVLTSLLIAFFFRIGELAAKGATSGGVLVQYSNLRFLTPQGSILMIKITITKFKIHRRPFDIL